MTLWVPSVSVAVPLTPTEIKVGVTCSQPIGVILQLAKGQIRRSAALCDIVRADRDLDTTPVVVIASVILGIKWYHRHCKFHTHSDMWEIRRYTTISSYFSTLASALDRFKCVKSPFQRNLCLPSASFLWCLPSRIFLKLVCLYRRNTTSIT